MDLGPDSPAPRRRRRSKDEPLDFSPNPRRRLSLPVSPFLTVYESSSQQLKDIISELHQDRPETNLQENLQESRAVGAWGLVTAAAAAVVAALVSALLLGWCSWLVILVSLVVGGLSAGLFWVLWRMKCSPDAALEREHGLHTLKDRFREELEKLMAALEELEWNLKELRAKEDDQQRRRTLHQIQMNLPDAKFNINHLNLLLLRSCEDGGPHSEEGVGGALGSEEDTGNRAVQQTLTELDQFVKDLRWAQDKYRES